MKFSNLSERRSAMGASAIFSAMMAAFAFMLGACGGGDSAPVGAGAPADEFMIAANDDQGNLAFFKATAASPVQTPIPQVGKVNFGTLGLGDIRFANGKALMVISSGLVGPGGLPSGGLAVVDIETQNVDAIVTLESTQTGIEARLVHAFVDPEEKYIWINNDGPRGNIALDSVFRVNIDPADPDFLMVTEIVTGNGHHKSAFSRASADQPGAKRLFVTHSLSDQSISVIDDDPNSANFLSVVKTVKNVGFVPHGMDYSPVSGHVYTGITGGGVTIIDATSPDVDDPAKNVFDFFDPDRGPDASVTKIDSNVIPASGYVHTAHGGKTVYTTGWREVKDAGGTVIGGEGFLSAIDASNNDTVIEVVALGNVAMSSFDESVSGKKVYVPSRTRTAGNPKTNVVSVVDIDPLSTTFHTVLKEITIGEAGSHRNGEISGDGSLAVYPDTCDTCNTIRVIDTATDTVIDTLVTDGHSPRVSILKTR